MRESAVGQAGGSCYSRAALSSNDSKTLYTVHMKSAMGRVTSRFILTCSTLNSFGKGHTDSIHNSFPITPYIPRRQIRNHSTPILLEKWLTESIPQFSLSTPESSILRPWGKFAHMISYVRKKDVTTLKLLPPSDRFTEFFYSA